jgi:hypothetical protein
MRSPVGSREAKGGEAKGGRERVVVAVRLRPSQRPSSVVRHDGKTVWLRDHVFSFDHVWGPDADQERVYKDVGSPILQHALRGFNGSILAYGQTGSGKTFTVRATRASARSRAAPRAPAHALPRRRGRAPRERRCWAARTRRPTGWPRRPGSCRASAPSSSRCSPPSASARARRSS